MVLPSTAGAVDTTRPLTKSLTHKHMDLGRRIWSKKCGPRASGILLEEDGGGTWQHKTELEGGHVVAARQWHWSSKWIF